MIPKIIHQTTNSYTWEEMTLIKKNKKIMPDFLHVLWGDEMNEVLFEKYFPNNVDDYLNFSANVVKADIARCLYLYDRGGIYCDTDYFFYRPIDAGLLAHRCVLGVEERENESVGGYKAGNAFMASEASFGLWLEFVESIFFRYRQGERNVVQIGGPHALTKFIKNNKAWEEKITFLPPEVVYPPFENFKLSTYRDQNTLGAHLCWGSWRKRGLMRRIRSRGRRIASAMLA